MNVWRVNAMYNRGDDVCTMDIIGLGDFCELPFASSFACRAVRVQSDDDLALQPPTFYIFPMLPAIVTLLAAASPDAIPAPAINVSPSASPTTASRRSPRVKGHRLKHGGDEVRCRVPDADHKAVRGGVHPKIARPGDA